MEKRKKKRILGRINILPASFYLLYFISPSTSYQLWKDKKTIKYAGELLGLSGLI